MATTVADVQASIRDNLDEQTAAYWSDAELLRRVVKSYRTLWKKIMALREDWFLSSTPGTLVITSGQTKYVGADGVPTSLYRIKSLRTTTSGKEFIRWVGTSQDDPEFIEGLRVDITQNDPYRLLYCLVGNQTIMVSPVPRQALTVNVEYIALPTDPTTTAGTFGILDPFTDYIISDVTVQALAKGPTGALEFWQAQRQEDWMNMMQTIGQPRQDQSPDVVQGAFDRY